jgi:hypothetical protein
VHIDRLDVTFLRSSPGDMGTWQAFYDLFAPRRRTVSKATALGVFDAVEAETADWSIPVDLANATEVRVTGLDWTVRCGAGTALRVRCRHARLTANAPHVVLRGRATVTTPDAMLQSNHIEMNVRDESLVVEGRYVLTRGARTRTGHGARFDRTLRPLGVEPSDVREDEKWASGSQLGAF